MYVHSTSCADNIISRCVCAVVFGGPIMEWTNLLKPNWLEKITGGHNLCDKNDL